MATAPNSYGSNRNAPRSKTLFYPDDSPEVCLLIMKLIEDKYYVTRASKHQIKHGKVNYYPSSGVITIEGEGRHTEKGPHALLALLEQRYPKRRGKVGDPQANPVEPTSPPSAPIFKIDLDDLDIPDDYDPVPSDRWDDEP